MSMNKKDNRLQCEIDNVKNVESYKKNCNEEDQATNEINPIDGRRYSDLPESDFVINRFDIEIKNPFPHLKPINPFKNNEFIKYQFSLAKMDLSYNKMSQNNYSLEEDNALALFKRMDKSRISLDLLNDAGGFNSALEQIEKENKHQMNRSLGQKHFASF